MTDTTDELEPIEPPTPGPAAPRVPPPRPPSGPRPVRRPVVANRPQQEEKSRHATGTLILVCALAIAAAGTATYLVRKRVLHQAELAAAQQKQAEELARAAAEPPDFGIPDPRQLYFGGREGSWWVSRLRALREKRLDPMYQLTVKRAEASGLRVVEGPDGPDIAAGPELTAALRRGNSKP